MKKRVKILIAACLLALTLPSGVQAHSGRTDSSGGHHDYKNKSGLGYYHYHCGGHPAHLHSGGVCPYSSSYSSSSSSSSSSVKRESIKVNNSKSAMTVYDEYELDIDVTSDSDSYSYKVKSSNTDVVKVKDDNRLVAVGKGTATITVKTDETSKSFNVTVKSIDVTKVKVSEKKLKLQLEEESQLAAEVLPANATNKDVKWESSNDSVVSVNQNGNLEAVGVGECIITVSALDNMKHVAQCKVQVYEVKPSEVKSDFDSLKLEITDERAMNITILPEDANNTDYTVEIADQNIIKVENNKIIPVKEGNTEVTITTWNGIKKVVPVEVFYNYETNIAVDESKTTYMFGNVLDINDEINISYKVEPEDATYQVIKLSSSNPNIVQVENENYKIVGTGKVTLTATSYNGIEESIEIRIVNLKNIAGSVVVGIVLVSGGIFIWRRKKGASIKLDKK